MPKESHFQITKLAMSEKEYFSEPNSMREIQKMTSNLKKWKIYDRQTSLTFFYSEIEKCWLVTINSGSCKINKRHVNFKSDNFAENCFVVEKNIEIEMNLHSFLFENLQIENKNKIHEDKTKIHEEMKRTQSTNNSLKNTQQAGISNILVHALLKSKDLTLKIETALQIISHHCEYYKDFYFVLDAIRKNRIFDYRCGEIRLNILELYNYVINDKSPILDSIIYESENGLIRDETKSFSVSRLWDSIDFIEIAEPLHNQQTEWPTPTELQSIMTGVLYNDLDKDALPSPRSTSRYINSYNVDRSTSTENESRISIVYSNYCSSEVDSEEMKDSSLSEDSSSKSVTENEALRNIEYVESKRPRYHFDFDLNPAMEKFVISGDSDTSAPYSDLDTRKKRGKEQKDVLRSASCVEDGFLFEKCTDVLQIPSTVEGYMMSLRRQKDEQQKNKEGNFKIAPLTRYDSYKIKKFG